MAEVDYKALKKGGFMQQVQKDHFALRLHIVGGQIPAGQLQKVTEVAQKYGQGYIHMTSRQSIEIPFIRLEDVEAVINELKSVGLEPGASGPRVRTITACQGAAICPSGLIDTTRLAKELDNRYFARGLPHKFKLGVTGCGNNCLKAEENDLGIKGGVRPRWQQDLCIYCGLCQAVCLAKAIEVRKEDKALSLDRDLCTYCGKCVKSCPTLAWGGERGFLLFFGGLFGNRIAIGKRILPLVIAEEHLYQVIDKTLEFFQTYGKPSERFRTTLDRVGWENFAKELEGLGLEH
ncbi:MAG TPA: 4Fe-4S binding protein [Desulfitobacterium dehalogenans]|uniref:4Fe-4S binding protein n=1 Tax=Desulfitobacterium dehalogenans TaxID=36854 RepID=A0A7C7D8N0_9FIRM|nr:4Fe-4S binding protein [Desulfitobacterium dehalogenans]